MVSDADQKQAQAAPAHRVTWFGGERPVEGATVFVKPPATEPAPRSTAATDAPS
jgi:hypothetical protein